MKTPASDLYLGVMRRKSTGREVRGAKPRPVQYNPTEVVQELKTTESNGMKQRLVGYYCTPMMRPESF